MTVIVNVADTHLQVSAAGCHAARMALVVFDPYMASRPLAEALLKSPPGQLIVDDRYYTFSSVFFYTNRRALLLNGRVNNLVYGSCAPDAPKDVFIGDRDFQQRWRTAERYYVVAEGPQVPRFQQLAGKDSLHTRGRERRQIPVHKLLKYFLTSVFNELRI